MGESCKTTKIHSIPREDISDLSQIYLFNRADANEDTILTFDEYSDYLGHGYSCEEKQTSWIRYNQPQSFLGLEPTKHSFDASLINHATSFAALAAFGITLNPIIGMGVYLGLSNLTGFSQAWQNQEPQVPASIHLLEGLSLSTSRAASSGVGWISFWAGFYLDIKTHTRFSLGLDSLESSYQTLKIANALMSLSGDLDLELQSQISDVVDRQTSPGPNLTPNNLNAELNDTSSKSSIIIDIQR